MNIRQKTVILTIAFFMGGQIALTPPALAAASCETSLSCGPAVAEEEGTIVGYGAALEVQFQALDAAFSAALAAVSLSMSRLGDLIVSLEANQAILNKNNVDADSINGRTTAEAVRTYENIVKLQPPVDLCVSLTATEEQQKAGLVAQAYEQSFDDQTQQQAVVTATTAGAQGAQLINLTEWEKKYSPQVADQKMQLGYTKYLLDKPALTDQEAEQSRDFIRLLAGDPVNFPKGQQLTTGGGFSAFGAASRILAMQALGQYPLKKSWAARVIPTTGGSVTKAQWDMASSLIHDLNVQARNASLDEDGTLKMINVSLAALIRTVGDLSQEMETSTHISSARLLETTRQYGEEIKKQYPTAGLTPLPSQ